MRNALPLGQGHASSSSFLFDGFGCDNRTRLSHACGRLVLSSKNRRRISRAFYYRRGNSTCRRSMACPVELAETRLAIPLGGIEPGGSDGSFGTDWGGGPRAGRTVFQHRCLSRHRAARQSTWEAGRQNPCHRRGTAPARWQAPDALGARGFRPGTSARGTQPRDTLARNR